jgi:hypothetical protein
MLLECVLLTVKSVGLVAVPPGVVTLILPVVAVVGTVAVIWVAEFTTNVAVTLLKVTALAVKFVPPTVPLKFVPVITTEVPVGPEVGVNEVIVGAGTATTVKVPLLRAVFPLTVTRIGPVVAPVGTVAVIWVAEFTTTPVADVWLNFTVAPVAKPVPWMTTDVPTAPVVGLKVPTVTGHGVASRVNASAGVVSPTPWITSTGALPAAPAGTTAEISVAETAWKTAVDPPNVTELTPAKPVPLMFTSHPTFSVVGETDVMLWVAHAGTAVSPTINVTPTSDPTTRTNARFPTNRPRSFMASTSPSASTSSRPPFSPPGVPGFHLGI